MRKKIGVKEDKGLLAQEMKRKLSKYCHWKHRAEGIVLTPFVGEVEGKARPGRRDTVWTGNSSKV